MTTAADAQKLAAAFNHGYCDGGAGQPCDPVSRGYAGELAWWYRNGYVQALAETQRKAAMQVVISRGWRGQTE